MAAMPARVVPRVRVMLLTLGTSCGCRLPISRAFAVTGADDETRTRDINLGKVALYQLSYVRTRPRALSDVIPPD